MNQLDVLLTNKDALLLAEAVGWLHDYRKCSDEHLQNMAPNRRINGLQRTELSRNFPVLSSVSLRLISLQPGSRTVIDLLDDRTWHNDLLGQYLNRCHRAAHFDKPKPIGGEQNYPGIQISTPFGFEKNVADNLTTLLWRLPWDKLASSSLRERVHARKAISSLFSLTIADTRRPINEVDLWSWGLLVGALYKSALAGSLLTGSTPAASDLRWRLLGIRVNGLDYLLNVARIPDLLARQELLSDGLNKVRDLIEVAYPLGSEVYRDENGSVYVVPDVPDLLQRSNGSGIKLSTLILQAFERGTWKGKSQLQLGGEIMPHVELESTSWWGQDPNWRKTSTTSNDILPNISSFISPKVSSPANAANISKFWKNREPTDVCTVCGLRPQGPTDKAAERNVCDTCVQRRDNRSQKWAITEPNKTIWSDEVADTNGRLALLVGHFELTHWLDGSMLNSLLLIAPQDPQNTEGKPVTSKTPSFSRIRRIWESARLFWQETQEEILRQLTDERQRIKITLSSIPNLGHYHVYDLDLGTTNLSVVWVPPQNNNNGYLIAADNFGYTARQLGAKAVIYTNPKAAADFVRDHLRAQFVENNRPPVLRNLETLKGQRGLNLLAGSCITDVDCQQSPYAAAIPILAEPRTFMMIVPADKALEMAQTIKTKYETEMDKVRDRLPLHLGLVFASRRTPIRAVLDAGRAILDYPSQQQTWAIRKKEKQPSKVTLEIEHNKRQIQWNVPDDQWYSYLFLETGGDDSKADASSRRAVKISIQTEKGHQADSWIVNAADLKIGEIIKVCPSTFDFEFLDTTARRFDIHYDANGRRPRQTRPFYLEDLERLERLWEYMKRLASSQRHQVIRTVEATREIWYGQDADNQSAANEVFQQFVADTLAGAAWPNGQGWNAISEDDRKKLVDAGVSGELTDWAELHMEIMKD
jgi:hypothetical protein